MKSSKLIPKKYKGFTLTELMVAVFVFSLAMITVTGIFARFVIVQKRAKAVQKNLEDARYAMELMAKTLRTSSIVSCNNGVACPAPPINASSVEIYDYSQGKCIRYYSSGGKIRTGSVGVADKASCSAGVIPAGSDIVSQPINNISFSAIRSASSPARVGKVTISVEVCSNSGCSGTDNDRVNIQTTVSLRDYFDIL